MDDKNEPGKFGSPLLGILFATLAVGWSMVSPSGIFFTAGTSKLAIAAGAFFVGYIFLDVLTFLIGGSLAVAVLWWLFR
jgi:hypothetical protein